MVSCFESFSLPGTESAQGILLAIGGACAVSDGETGSAGRQFQGQSNSNVASLRFISQGL
eukprot:473563-Amphidinium_carterae.1